MNKFKRNLIEMDIGHMLQTLKMQLWHKKIF